MSLLKNLFGRREEVLTEEEMEHIDDNSEFEDQEVKNPHTIEDLVRSLNTQDEINRLRNLLDKRERDITGNYDLHKVEEEKSHYDLVQDIRKVNYEEKIVEPEFNEEKTKTREYDEPKNPEKSFEEINQRKVNLDFNKNEDISFQSQEDNEEENNKVIEPDFLEEEDYIDDSIINKGSKIDTTQLEKEKEDKDFLEIDEKQVNLNEDTFPMEADLFYQRVCDIFGNHNCSKKQVYGRFLSSIGKRDLFQIGVYKSEAMGEDVSIEEQSSWFISQIKQLEELKNFKVLNSKDGLKDLIWDKDEKNAIVISFKAVQFLNENKFDFTL